MDAIRYNFNKLEEQTENIYEGQARHMQIPQLNWSNSIVLQS